MYNSVGDILDAIKSGALKVAKMSNETGIPASRMYKWKDRNSKISSDDADKLREWLSKLDNSPRGTSEKTNQAGVKALLSTDGLALTVEDYIAEIKRQRDFAENMALKYLGKIDSNLSTALGGVTQVSLHVESAREVIMESLARLEGKKPGSLTAEADRIVVSLMKEHAKHRSKAAADR